jgi:hypothetical protein
MSRQIRLSTKGRQNIEVATINLKIMGRIGIVSEFDFSIEYGIRSILKTKAGSVGLDKHNHTRNNKSRTSIFRVSRVCESLLFFMVCKLCV